MGGPEPGLKPTFPPPGGLAIICAGPPEFASANALTTLNHG